MRDKLDHDQPHVSPNFELISFRVCFKEQFPVVITWIKVLEFESFEAYCSSHLESTNDRRIHKYCTKWMNIRELHQKVPPDGNSVAILQSPANNCVKMSVILRNQRFLLFRVSWQRRKDRHSYSTSGLFTWHCSQRELVEATPPLVRDACETTGCELSDFWQLECSMQSSIAIFGKTLFQSRIAIAIAIFIRQFRFLVIYTFSCSLRYSLISGILDDMCPDVIECAINKYQSIQFLCLFKKSIRLIAIRLLTRPVVQSLIVTARLQSPIFQSDCSQPWRQPLRN